MQIARILILAASCAAVLSACADGPAEPHVAGPEPESPLLPLGVYEVTITGADGSAAGGASFSRAVAVPQGPSDALNPVGATLALESVSTTTYSEGTRTTGGQRFIMATFRVRNTSGAPLSNVTLMPVTRPTTLAGTPFNTLLLFSGAPAPASIAAQIVPTGAVGLGDDGRIRSSYPDVLQAFTEAEVAAVTLPAGTTGVFPYGFVVRNPRSTTDRTLPNAATSSDWGLVTFAFRYPMQAAASGDPFSISFAFLAVQDTETRMTESIEERQDSAGVRRLRERAAALGATTVTVLGGSAALDAAVADYPGQRQVCTLRTAGSAGAPTTTIHRAGPYTDLVVYRPGETVDGCGANYAAGTAQTASTSGAYNLTVRAMDRYGNVRTTAVDTVTLARVSGPAATFGAAAGLASGVATIPVTYASGGPSLIQATGRNTQSVPTPVQVGLETVSVYVGNSQAAMAGTTLPTRPAVRLRYEDGTAIAGRQVVFSVAGGGGSVTTATAVTDASGVATVGNWTLGATAELNTLTATVAGAGVANNPVQFTAAGCEGGGGSGYGITLCYNSTLTPAQRTVFQNSAARWATVITGDVPDFPAQTIGANTCGTGSPGLSNVTIDDLVIFASITAIDGPGAVLGSAGWCYRRSGSLPLVGLMRFDVADVASMETSGMLGDVILHEMGHVLGVGTLWSQMGMLQSPSSAGSTLDTYFSGANGIAGFNGIGGSTYTGGQKVPVENTGGSGTINAHWRESVLANELMTGYLNGSGGNPMSLLTVRSLTDLGYTVNTGAADSFFLTLSQRAQGSGTVVDLGNDLYDGPRYTIDRQGRFSRVVQ